MKLIQLHNKTWIDAHDVDAIEPHHGSGLGGPFTKIRMKSGNEVILHPRGSLHVGFSVVLQEVEEVVRTIQLATSTSRSDL